MQYTLYVAVILAANENHTLWFLIFVKSTSGSVVVYVVLTLLLHVNGIFPLYYRIRIQGDKTYPLIFYCGHK